MKTNAPRNTAVTGKTAFVTGGTGFVGSHLVEELKRRGYGEVRCLVRSRLKWLDGLDIVPVEGGLDDEDALREGVRGVDYVYHVAGLTRATAWEAFEEANVRGTLRLLDAVRAVNPNVKRVLVTSSLAAVGEADVPVADETTPLRPISQYGKSKALMEERLAPYHADLPLVVVRPPAVYGPREADIFTFFKTVDRGLCPIVGEAHRPDLSLVHVRDLVRGMVDAAEHEATPGQTYFLGSEEHYSWAQIRDATMAALGKKALTVPIPGALVEVVGAVAEGVGRLLGTYPPLNREKAREIRRACKMCAVDKARAHFGYRQTIPLEDGLRETIAWYRSAGWL
ncbi:MAG: NAD-dependent epimerase/dehydratase family protein [Bacteroidetes bacterium]|nr:MAG: NAD-dependent epimerase/dehydratase family protein [Bacteroidota bacterium]